MDLLSIHVNQIESCIGSLESFENSEVHWSIQKPVEYLLEREGFELGTGRRIPSPAPKPSSPYPRRKSRTWSNKGHFSGCNLRSTRGIYLLKTHGKLVFMVIFFGLPAPEQELAKIKNNKNIQSYPLALFAPVLDTLSNRSPNDGFWFSFLRWERRWRSFYSGMISVWDKQGSIE